jgi:hypothetical protein
MMLVAAAMVVAAAAVVTGEVVLEPAVQGLAPVLGDELGRADEQAASEHAMTTRATSDRAGARR